MKEIVIEIITGISIEKWEENNEKLRRIMQRAAN